MQGTRHSYQRRKPCPVVGNSRSGHAAFVAMHLHVSSCRENRVEMRGQEYDAFGVRTKTLADHISDIIRTNNETGFSEQQIAAFSGRPLVAERG